MSLGGADVASAFENELFDALREGERAALLFVGVRQNWANRELPAADEPADRVNKSFAFKEFANFAQKVGDRFDRQADVLPIGENLERRRHSEPRATRFAEEIAKNLLFGGRKRRPTGARLGVGDDAPTQVFDAAAQLGVGVGVEFDDERGLRRLRENRFEASVPIPRQRDDATVEKIAKSRFELENFRNGPRRFVERVEKENRRRRRV